MNRRFARILVAGLGTAILLAGQALADMYSIDKVHSSVGFSIRHLVGRTSGRFNDFSGALQYDPKQPAKTTIEATIQVTSIDTDNEKRDNHLRSPEFFEVDKYPTMSFKSTGAEKKGDRLLITGDFTMHGVTRSITLPVEVLGTGTHPRSGAPLAGFETLIILKRSDYGVTNYTDPAGVLGDEVKVNLTIEAQGEK